ncbi:MAG: tetratricopeptide repeat protein, partial [Candidatus Thorarchaeota archaeon]
MTSKITDGTGKDPLWAKIAGILSTHGYENEASIAQEIYGGKRKKQPNELNRLASCILEVQKRLLDDSHLPIMEGIYRAALELQPTQYQSLQGLGMTLYRQGKLDEAEEIGHRILALRGHDSLASLLFGLLNAERGNHSDAVQFFRQIIREMPKHAVSWGGIAISSENLEVGRIYVESMKEIVKDVASWIQIGITLFDLRRYDDSEDVFKFITKLDPSNREGWRGLGRSLMLQGEKEKAKEALKKIGLFESEEP